MKQLRQVSTSQTLLINEQSRLLQQQGKEVYKFGFGQSPFPPPQSAIDALARHAHEKFYAPVQGLPELREAIASFHKACDNIDIQAKDIVVAPGSKILLYATMACFTDAVILLPAPAWVSYKPQADLLGHQPVKVATDYTSRWRITPESLDATITQTNRPDAQHILILNYPGNPDGLTYSDTELEALTAIARKHDVLVLSDEIYGLLHHDGAHRSIAHHYPEGTLISTGLSKWAGAGGWRIGALLMPESVSEALMPTMLGIASEIWSCATTPVELAAIEAYQWNAEVRTYVEQQRRILKQLAHFSHAQLVEAGLQCHPAQGGFYLFPDFSPKAEALAKRGIRNSASLCNAILDEAGVALLPGTAFGMGEEALVARLSYVDFNGKEALREAMLTPVDTPLPDDFIAQYCDRVQLGINALCDWVQAQ